MPNLHYEARFCLTDFAADRAAVRETVPVRAELLTTLFGDDGFCERALPAADFEVLLVRPSRRVLEAAFAAVDEVVFLGAFVCDSALPAAFFEVELVELLRSVFEALDAAFLLVTLDFAMQTSSRIEITLLQKR